MSSGPARPAADAYVVSRTPCLVGEAEASRWSYYPPEVEEGIEDYFARLVTAIDDSGVARAPRSSGTRTRGV
jgi:hypothetical protein